MNCLIIEGSGRGGVLYEHRCRSGTTGKPYSAPAIDWLIGRPGVDPDALVLFGRSFAGYLSPRGANRPAKARRAVWWPMIPPLMPSWRR